MNNIFYLISVTLNHNVNGHADQPCGDTLSSILLSHGQHGYVTSHRTPSVWFQLRYNHADEFVVGVKSLHCFGARFSGQTDGTFVRAMFRGQAAHHEAKVSPLVEEIAVDTDTVGFGEII